MLNVHMFFNFYDTSVNPWGSIGLEGVGGGYIYVADESHKKVHFHFLY